MRKLRAIIGTALVITGISGGHAWATEALPVIDASSGQLSSSNLYSGDTLSFSVRITDDVGCCSWVGWGVYTAPGMNVNSGEILWTLNNNSPSSYRISGDQLDGRYAYSLVIPNNIAPGTYYLKVQATDNAGGYTHLDQIGSFVVSALPSTSATNTPATVTASPTPAPTVSNKPSSSPSPSEQSASSPDKLELETKDQNSLDSKWETESPGIFFGIAGSVILGLALGVSYAYIRQKQGKPLFPVAQQQKKASKAKPNKSKR